MNSNTELSLSAINQKRNENNDAWTPENGEHHSSAELSAPLASGVKPGQVTQPSVELVRSRDEEKALPVSLPFDPWRVLDAASRSLKIGALVGVILGASVYIVAKLRIRPHYKASTQLVRQNLPDSFRASDIGESYKPHEIPMPVLTASIMRGRSLLERVGHATSPPMSADELLSGLDITTDRKSEVIQASFVSTISEARAVEVANRYADEVVKITKDLQIFEAAQVNEFLKLQLKQCDADLTQLGEEMLRYAKEAELLDGDREMDAYLSQRANLDLKYEAVRLDHETLDLKIQAVEHELAKVSPLAVELQNARTELSELRTRYTDLNPIVEEKRERIKSLEDKLNSDGAAAMNVAPKAGESPIAESLFLQRIELLTQKFVLAEQLKKMELTRTHLTQKLNQLPRKTFEYAQMRAKRQSLDATRQLLGSRQREAELFMANPLGYYRVLRNATLEDVVTDHRRSKKFVYTFAAFGIGLLLVTFGYIFFELADRRVKTPADLRRLTHLSVLASITVDESNNAASRDTWSFRTWTRLQSKIRRADGAVVCGLLADSDSKDRSAMAVLLADAAAWRGATVLVITAKAPTDRPTLPVGEAVDLTLKDGSKWLDSGKGVLFLSVDESWTWSAEERARFEKALNIWSRRKEAVIFVELPPASQPEALLMAERLPQLIWVEGGGHQPSGTINETLETYRHAGCNLLGAMLNRAPRLRFGTMNPLGGVATILIIGGIAVMNSSATAASLEARQPAAATPDSTRPKLKSITLGAGDMVNITMYGHPELERKQVALAPDGHLTYLQAQNVMAQGLTLDELRDKLDAELGKFYTHPRVIVTPEQFQSRKVYVLGKVVKKGMVNYDRPLTLLEAITEAGGLETGLFQQNTVELADLGHSFVSRKGERLKVDFEALFSRGDFSQNILLQPDDYIYFPSANNNEVYVIGNVRSQGTQGLLAQSSVTSAITLAGGFTTRAFRDRVLVIRGSLEKPQTFVVDMNAVLNGRAKGFRLQPNDILYIADKPWARAEELLDLAITTFLQGAVSAYTGAHVDPLITHPFIR